MLVLTRKTGDSIIIGDDIKVIVLGVGLGGTVKIGVSAPTELSVHRKEVYDRIVAGEK